MSSRAWQAVGFLLSISLVLALAATARSDGPLPRLTGPALAGPTHLHLVISGAPPYIYDVDARRVRPVSKSAGPLGDWVRPGGTGAFVASGGCCASTQVAKRIQLDGSVRRLATGRSVAPAAGSSATWVLRRLSAGNCRLKLVPGARQSVPAPCRRLSGAGEAGVLMWTSTGTLLVDPLTGQIRAEARRIFPVHGDVVLEEVGTETSLPDDRLALVDLATGASRRFKLPSILRGLDEVVVQPHGTLIAVGFADPAYPGPAQAFDVWMLDTATGAFTHLPGLPAQVDLKFSSMAWTSDDRLVLLLQGGGRTVLAIWRPGTNTLPLRPVQLPEHTGGSDTFVALVGP
ncbi:MAG: hypothetical protein QOD65_3805 [Gaiellales bacterium]|nr:hypothetical protein [Gaiellales bacterium]